jgi:hypothetical protein
MMGKTEHTITGAGGLSQTVGISNDECSRMVRVFSQKVLSEIVRAADWDFLLDDADDTTVISQAQYTLKGNNDDCAEVINIRYGDNDAVLEKKNVLETDRRTPDQVDSGIYCWTIHGRSDQQFPIIEIHNTPTEAKAFHYRYRKLITALEQLPDYLNSLVYDGVIAEFYPEYVALYRASLDDAVGNYTRKGDEIDKFRKDPAIEAGNIRRSGDMQGGA